MSTYDTRFIVGLERFIEDDQRFRRLLARSMAPRGSQVNKRPPLGLGDKPRPNGDALYVKRLV